MPNTLSSRLVQIFSDSYFSVSVSYKNFNSPISRSRSRTKLLIGLFLGLSLVPNNWSCHSLQCWCAFLVFLHIFPQVVTFWYSLLQFAFCGHSLSNFVTFCIWTWISDFNFLTWISDLDFWIWTFWLELLVFDFWTSTLRLGLMINLY